MEIKRVTVIGANGTMGRNITGIFASFGQAKVYAVCRTMEKAIFAKEKAELSVKAEVIGTNIIPKDYSTLEECISESDLIFDSVTENLDIKTELNSIISKHVKESAIICTGTSGLSIGTLADAFTDSQKKRYLGLHMFNPPYNLNLCEIIPSNYTDKDLLDKIKEYATNILKRTVVEVSDSPAFLGNRIGFQVINEAMQYAVKYADNGGIDYIDAILGQFTGRSMAPLNTTDFVGLDIHKSIVDNIFDNTNDYLHDTFKLPEFAQILIDKGNLGRKSGEGFYKITKYHDGKRNYEVYDINNNEYRKVNNFVFEYKSEMIEYLKNGNYTKAMKILVTNKSLEATITLEFLLKYIIYSLNIAKLVAKDVHAADDVMATGFNWIPPLSLVEALGGSEVCMKLAKERLGLEYCNAANAEVVFQNLPKSKYDYRKFLRARG